MEADGVRVVQVRSFCLRPIKQPPQHSRHTQQCDLSLNLPRDTAQDSRAPDLAIPNPGEADSLRS